MINKIIVVGKPEYATDFIDCLGDLDYFVVDSTSMEFIACINWHALGHKISSEKKKTFGFISLPSGFIPQNASLIAEFRNFLELYGIKIKKTFCLPSNLTNIVDNKLLTYEYLRDVQETSSLIPFYLTKENYSRGKLNKYPVVFKKFHESGGRGNTLVREFNSLKKLAWESGFITEFLHGIEVTQTVLVLNRKIIFMPQTWKSQATHTLIHSDRKPKFSGLFDNLSSVMLSADKIIKTFGLEHDYMLSMQGIYSVAKKSTNYKLLELESRITGSTPIMEAVVGTTVYNILNAWMHSGKNFTMVNKKTVVACQFMSYSPKSKELEAKDIIGIKPEYNKLRGKYRYRISFIAPNSNSLLKKAVAIGQNIDDFNFGRTVIRHYKKIMQYMK